MDRSTARSNLSLPRDTRRHTPRPIALLKEHLGASVIVYNLSWVRDMLADCRWRYAEWHRHCHGLLTARPTLQHLRCRELLRHLFLLVSVDHLHLLLEHQLLVLQGQLLLHGCR